MEENKYPIGGFAPGNYQCNCCKCGTFFHGDKRAVECEPCAVAAKEKFDALSPEEQAGVIKRNAEAVNEVFKDWGKKPDVNLAIIGHGEPELNHDRVISNQVAGMPLEEAIFQDGYSAGHDAGYEKGRQEAKPGAVWVRASEFKCDKSQYRPARAKSTVGAPYVYLVLFVGVYDGRITLNEPDDNRRVFQEDQQWEDYEILDESGAAAAAANLHPAIYNRMKEAKANYNSGYKRGEEDAVAFAEWAISEGWKTSHDHTGWMKHSDETPYVLTTVELYELFKQQKPPVTLTQSRADFICEANNRDLDGVTREDKCKCDEPILENMGDRYSDRCKACNRKL